MREPYGVTRIPRQGDFETSPVKPKPRDWADLTFSERVFRLCGMVTAALTAAGITVAWIIVAVWLLMLLWGATIG